MIKERRLVSFEKSKRKKKNKASKQTKEGERMSKGSLPG